MALHGTMTTVYGPGGHGGHNPNAPTWDPEKNGVALHGTPSSGPGGEESPDCQASTAGHPPQGDTAALLGEGCSCLVPVGGGHYIGQPREGPAVEVQDVAPTHPASPAGEGQGLLSLADTAADPFRELRDRLVEVRGVREINPENVCSLRHIIFRG